MFLEGLFKSSNHIKGDIGYYNLQDWWLGEFTDEERKEIEATYKPMGSEQSSPLTNGEISWSSQTITMFLATLSGWFNNPRQRNLANKIIEKAVVVANQNKNDILGNHFLYSDMISIYYPQRERDGMMDKIVEVCRIQISLAPQVAKAFLHEYADQELPGHKGYEQLVIILDKQNKSEEAIAVCQQAKEQGWSGGWDKRIARYEKKIRKQ